MDVKPSKEIDNIWESSEYRVTELIEKLDGLFFEMLNDAVLHGVKRPVANDYFAKKFLNTIYKVADNRETEAQQIKRQEKQIREYKKNKSTFWCN